MAEYLHSPVHAVLRNQELLANIFRQLSWDPHWQAQAGKAAPRKHRIELRNLALICRAFRDPALGILWFYMESLLPLVKVLPNVQKLDNAYYFHGIIADDSPFRLYARRVRFLNLKTPPMRSTPSAQGQPTISPHLLLYLSKELQGQPLLPSLQTLEVRNHTLDTAMDYFAALPFLCSGSLRSVSLYGASFSHPMFASCCLPSMSQSLGSLKTFVFKCSSKDAGASLPNVLFQLSTLEYLALEVPETLGIPPTSLLKMLKKLNNLTTLELDVHFPNHEVTDASFQRGAVDLGLFLKLQYVTVTSRLLNRICPCIPRVLLEKMTRFDMRVPKRMIANDPAPFAAVAQSLSEFPTLKYFRISSRHTVIKNTTTLLPILKRLSLRDFRVEIPFHSQEPPLAAFISEAFKQPPRSRRNTLRWLYLIHGPTGGPAPADEGVTLTCLDTVARHAIGLENLSVILRPSFTDMTPGGMKLGNWLAFLKRGPKSVSTLQLLRIYDAKDATIATTFEEADNLAEILDFLFPRLAYIKPFNDEGGAYWTQRWAFIENLRRMKQSTRRSLAA